MENNNINITNLSNLNIDIDSNLSVNAQMDLAFEGMINLQKVKAAGNRLLTLSMAKSISEKLEGIFAKYMVEKTLVKKFTGVKTTKKELSKTLLGLQPSIVFETDQGLVGIAHGTEDGAVGYTEVDYNGPHLHRVELKSKEFLDLFSEVAPGQEMYLISCFPGAKPKEWKVQGRTFKNLGTKFQQLYTVLDEEKKELYVGYGSPKMIEHWDKNNGEEAGQLLAQAIQAWLAEGYSIEDICEIF